MYMQSENVVMHSCRIAAAALWGTSKPFVDCCMVLALIQPPLPPFPEYVMPPPHLV